MEREVAVGLLGCGTVGTGVARILTERRELIASRLGARLVLKRVADLDTSRDRGVFLEAGVLTTDARSVVDDPSIPIVVELIGGKGVARDLLLRALENGKSVVTANKALIASHGEEIARVAAAKGVDFYFEGSVGGCMPVIKALRESLVGNRILSLFGILNGTCNYILSMITAQGKSFEEALAEAQASGYAEADPTLDVEGLDTVHKLAICMALSYGMKVRHEDIYVEGISRITPLDIELAKQFGYRVKLLAITKKSGDAVEARVHPTMIPAADLLSNVEGAVNALKITGDAVGEMLLYGYGAGMMPTASAVVGDIVDLARNLLSGAKCRVPIFSYQPESIRPLPLMPMDAVVTSYYIRFSALDRPGVLSRISGILGQYGISIRSVHQKGRKIKGSVPIVMLTHEAREADVQSALTDVSSLDDVVDRPVLIRIEDEAEP